MLSTYQASDIVIYIYDIPLVLSSDQWQWMLSYSVVSFNIHNYV